MAGGDCHLRCTFQIILVSGSRMQGWSVELLESLSGILFRICIEVSLSLAPLAREWRIASKGKAQQLGSVTEDYMSRLAGSEKINEPLQMCSEESGRCHQYCLLTTSEHQLNHSQGFGTVNISARCENGKGSLSDS